MLPIVNAKNTKKVAFLEALEVAKENTERVPHAVWKRLGWGGALIWFGKKSPLAQLAKTVGRFFSRAILLYCKLLWKLATKLGSCSSGATPFPWYNFDFKSKVLNCSLILLASLPHSPNLLYTSCSPSKALSHFSFPDCISSPQLVVSQFFALLPSLLTQTWSSGSGEAFWLQMQSAPGSFD